MDLHQKPWQMPQPSPKSNMKTSSMRDAMHPPNASILKNSTTRHSNVQQAKSYDSMDDGDALKRTYVKPANGGGSNGRPIINNPPTTINIGDQEVDYYHNPTELFRWINYRRWDGARARVNSNPEECAVWVASRHSTDGRVLWRQLPLHLVCMQSGVKLNFSDENRDVGDSSSVSMRNAEEEVAMHNVQLKQVEDLVEELIDAYPDATRQQDDQGMLPLHSSVNHISSENGPNERVISLLLLANATALNMKDQFGRTPIDIIREKTEMTGTIPGAENTLRLMLRAKDMMSSIKGFMKNEADDGIREVEQRAENERQASQRIIRRLEQELADEQNRANMELNSAGEVRETSNILKEELRMIKKDYDTLELDLDQTRKERDDLVSKNEILRNELDKQEDIVSQIKREAEKELDEQKQTTASLRSEASTARAMAEGMETQLRSKFTDAENSRNTITQLRKEMATLHANSKRETKKLMEDVERLEDELKHAKNLIDELSAKNESQEKNKKDLEKHLGQVLVSFQNLSNEYDQLNDSSAQKEHTMMEMLKSERNSMNSSLEKQKKLMEAAFVEQAHFMAEANKKQSTMSARFTQDRKKDRASIQKIKEDFQAVRTQLSAKHCIVTESVMKKSDSFQMKINKSSPSFIPSPNQMKNRFSSDPQQGVHPKTTSPPDMTLQSSTIPTHHSHEQTGTRSASSLPAPEFNRPASELPAVVSKEEYKSPGFLKFLEERAKTSGSRRPLVNKDQVDSQTPNPSSSLGTRTQSHPMSTSKGFNTEEDKMYSSISNKSDSKLPTVSFDSRRSYSTTPNNSTSVMRQLPSHYREKDDDSVSRQKSFSLDEFSDVDSRISVSTFGDQREQYRGMRSALKRGTISLGDNTTGMDMSNYRQNYSPHDPFL